MIRDRTLVASSAMIVLWTSVAFAQGAPARADTAAPPVTGSIVGLSYGLPGFRGETLPELFTLGVQWTHADPHRVGLDFSVGVPPRAFLEGVAVLGFRGGFAFPIALGPHVLVLPSAGGSLVAGLGGGGAAVFRGFNTGLATVLLSGSRGFRTGVTCHWFEGEPRPLWLWETGIVWLSR